MTLSYILYRFNGFKQDVFGAGIGDALPPLRRSETSSRKRMRRSNFAEDRIDILEGISDVLSNTLAINGTACVQRLICEVAEVPVDKISLWGEILHHIIE